MTPSPHRRSRCRRATSPTRRSRRVGAIDAAVARGAPVTRRLGDAVWRDLARPGPGLARLPRRRSRVRARRAQRQLLAAALGRRARVDPTHATTTTVERARRRRVAARRRARRRAHRAVGVRRAARATTRCSRAPASSPARELYEMRVPLPDRRAIRVARPASPCATSCPGSDEAAWLEVNNRAFANHPEQGAWIEATLARRMAEPWFDPSTLRARVRRPTGLAGFNWCKVHPPPRDAIRRSARSSSSASIPVCAGSGLGRPLALEGLARLARSRCSRRDRCSPHADNARALKLYREPRLHGAPRSTARTSATSTPRDVACTATSPTRERRPRAPRRARRAAVPRRPGVRRAVGAAPTARRADERRARPCAPTSSRRCRSRSTPVTEQRGDDDMT